MRVAAGEGHAQAEAIARRLRAAGLEVEYARPVAPSLEDVFIDRVGRMKELAQGGVSTEGS